MSINTKSFHLTQMWDFSVSVNVGKPNAVNWCGARSLPSTPWIISQQHLNRIADDNTSLICIASARRVYAKSAK